MLGLQLQLQPVTEANDRRSADTGRVGAVRPAAAAGSAGGEDQPARRAFAEQLGDQVRQSQRHETGRNRAGARVAAAATDSGKALPERRAGASLSTGSHNKASASRSDAAVSKGPLLQAEGTAGRTAAQRLDKEALPDVELLLLAMEQAGKAGQSLDDWLGSQLGDVPEELTRDTLLQALANTEDSPDVSLVALTDLRLDDAESAAAEPFAGPYAPPVESVEFLQPVTDELAVEIDEPPAEFFGGVAMNELQSTLEELQETLEALLEAPEQALRDDLTAGEIPAAEVLASMLRQLDTLADRLDVPAEKLFSQLSGLEAEAMDEALAALLDRALSGDRLTDDPEALETLTAALEDWLTSLSSEPDIVTDGADVTPPTLFERAVQALQADLQAGDGDSEEEQKPVTTRQEGQERLRDRALLEALVSRSEREASRLAGSEDSGPLRMASDNAGARLDQRGALNDPIRAHIERELPLRYSTGEAARQIGERLVMMIGQDIHEARIRLDPPEMGAIDVRVTTQGDQVQVQIVAQQPMVRDLLEQQANRLREQLEQQGFTEVEVDIGDREAAEEQRARSESDAADDADENAGQGASEALARPRGLVDQYV